MIAYGKILHEFNILNDIHNLSYFKIKFRAICKLGWYLIFWFHQLYSY